MIILGIESSCDETAVSVLDFPKKILSSLVSSQVEIHARFGGVVPEIASRRHMETIVPIYNKALKDARVSMRDIDAIGVTCAPGLIGALLVGLSFAKSIAYAHKKPLIGVNHLEGHLNAAHLEYDDIEYPHIGLVVSGGHTSLYLVKAFGKYIRLGATRDDAAGEAYDKVAKLLGLGYPGGPIIDRLSKTGDPKAFRFTRPKMGTGSPFEIGELDFSFSGLKTAVMLEFKRSSAKGNGVSERLKADIAASFQATVVDILIKQVVLACERYKCRALVVSGGVAANSGLRNSLAEACSSKLISLYLPGIKFCTDNAAMIAYVAGRRFEAGDKSDLSLAATANQDICS